MNRQNGRRLWADPSNILHIRPTKIPASVVVSVVVNREGASFHLSTGPLICSSAVFYFLKNIWIHTFPRVYLRVSDYNERHWNWNMARALNLLHDLHIHAYSTCYSQAFTLLYSDRLNGA